MQNILLFFSELVSFLLPVLGSCKFCGLLQNSAFKSSLGTYTKSKSISLWMPAHAGGFVPPALKIGPSRRGSESKVKILIC